MGYDRIIAFGYSVIASNYFKQTNMNENNIKLEDIIKRDDFISVVNESNEVFGQPVCGVPIHSFYKVKMRSKRELSGRGTPYQSWRYYDMFNREVRFPEYFFMISKPLPHHFVVDKDFNLTVRNYWDHSPIAIGSVIYHNLEDAKQYIYANKKVATQKELDKKTEEAYKSGKEVGQIDERMSARMKEIEERRRNEQIKIQALQDYFKTGIDPYRK